jgi:glycosyltransferase involved in cell wall biosynthesis
MSAGQTSPDTPAVTVVIPTYNRAHLISRAVESVLAQTFAELELLVVDDGSTDRTPEVMAGYADPRLTYIRKAHAERSAARNHGLERARGSLVAFLDSDDWFLPDKLARQVPVLDTDPKCAAVLAGWRMVRPDGTVLSEERPWEHLTGQPTLRDWLFASTAAPCAVLFRTEVVRAVGGYAEDMSFAEDMELLTRLSAKGYRFGMLPAVVAAQQWHEGNSMRDFDSMRQGRFTFVDRAIAADGNARHDPEERRQILARQHLVLACLGYSVGRIETARSDLRLGVELDPAWLAADGVPLVELVVAQTYSHLVEDPPAYLDTVFSNLPENLSWLRRHRRRAVAGYWAIQAFEAYGRADWPGLRRAAWLAATDDPGWLRNRGFVSIWARALWRTGSSPSRHLAATGSGRVKRTVP